MKIGPFVIGKDGGSESTVDGLLFELKGWFSVGILRFKDGSREAWHSHAFNCWSLLLRGTLFELPLDPSQGFLTHFAGARIRTLRTDCHKVCSVGTSYVLTFRGPWSQTWLDCTELPSGQWDVATLRDGRVPTAYRTFDSRREAAMFVNRHYEKEGV